ncbi:MAG: TldD/PmbA family protein [Nitrospirae bacterium]|nr:MAG: TldD/PmbA family protein [Nitrospirota bacterium]
MISLATLKSAVQRALRQAAQAKDVQEAEVYASSTGHLLCRLNYTSAIPCNGVEEPKSSEAFGLGIRAVFSGTDGPRIGFGSEARDLSPTGIKRALEKARQNAVPDPEFMSFPAPPQARSPKLAPSHDRAIMDLKDGTLVEAGWKVLQEALKTFASSEPLAKLAGSKEKLANLGLIVGGDVSLFRQRIAIGSTRMPKVQTDESTYITSSVTSMVERKAAKGSGYAAATHLAKFKGEAGADAARNAILGAGGQRLPSGTYNVVLGPQPVADLMTNLLLPSLSADAFYSCKSAFLGEVGRPVAADLLTIYDHGAAKGFVGTKRLTCEGLPTGRTNLIQAGVLQGLLSNHYETQRLLKDPRAREKLGLNPQEHQEVLIPRNGFRLSNSGGRQFDALPSIAATNLFIEGSAPHSRESLLASVGTGVYIGRIWYTYAMNGLRAGDFTCTVVGDSFLIQDGRLTAPLRGNTIRITGNIRSLLRQVTGVTKQAQPIIGWSADEVIYAPEIAVRGLHLAEIAQFMESV